MYTVDCPIIIDAIYLQHDKSIATYLLPYVLITILKQGNTDLDQLVGLK